LSSVWFCSFFLDLFFVSFQFFTCDFVPHVVCNFCFEFHLLAKFKEKRKKSKWNYLCHAQSSTSCKPKTPFALFFFSLFKFFIFHFFYFAIYVLHFIYFYPMFDFVQEWASMLLFYFIFKFTLIWILIASFLLQILKFKKKKIYYYFYFIVYSFWFSCCWHWIAPLCFFGTLCVFHLTSMPILWESLSHWCRMILFSLYGIGVDICAMVNLCLPLYVKNPKKV